jgi:hypothetical protein
MDGFYASNAVFANPNRAVIFSDDISEVNSIDYGKEYCEDCVKQREGNSECTKEGP